MVSSCRSPLRAYPPGKPHCRPGGHSRCLSSRTFPSSSRTTPTTPQMNLACTVHRNRHWSGLPSRQSRASTSFTAIATSRTTYRSAMAVRPIGVERVFAEHRGLLHAVAYRVLGSVTCLGGDLNALMEVLAPDVILVSDGR